MASSLAIVEKFRTQQRTHVIATASFSGSYATGGDVPTVTGGSLPDISKLNYQGWESANGFVYHLVRSTGKIKTLASTTETVAGAYPAGITGDSVRVHLIYEE